MKFDDLWNIYPTVNQKELFESLGGGWPELVGRDGYENTCTVRLSAALIAVGVLIPDDLARKDGGHRDGDGNNMIIKVATARVLLERLLGPSAWGVSKLQGVDYMGAMPAWAGIMLYLVPNSDASGHVDLWNKSTCRVNCHENFARNATSLEIWRLG